MEVHGAKRCSASAVRGRGPAAYALSGPPPRAAAPCRPSACLVRVRVRVRDRVRVKVRVRVRVRVRVGVRAEVRVRVTVRAEVKVEVGVGVRVRVRGHHLVDELVADAECLGTDGAHLVRVRVRVRARVRVRVS